ncbi:peptide deformylase [Intrasporangium calvum]|uniref:Peptide deformylase n=1 Tax=Intrasporangium calvum (strain ATCC 23552 / DSM 43043 / JCM 3097 / NBRC 12989 / NCIMB 10167 / NRRL B-3866 / 7 KIP) TaxID=710696 RepID=E6SDM3_INTC7|nr:peptide deformylase [Intrasporangium calvum]ADU48675.1 peptide deformylase [Intrasporangium calvum DSM 43043]
MAVRPIVISGEPVLHRSAALVTEFDDELRQLVGDMHETNDAANGVGLAAPQIGVGLRVFIWKMDNEDGVPARGHIINPTVRTSRIPQERPDPREETEGCLSVPGESFPLKRAERAHVVGLDLEQNRVEFDATGWFARCMQHEYDHLNGTLYVDRLDDRQAKKARKAVKRNGWGKPGQSWLPGVDPDPFGHEDVDDTDRQGEQVHAIHDQAHSEGM